MAERTHRATAHRSAVAGIQALSITSDRAFPRHDHDQFGFGVMTHGGHRSWSAIGTVEAVAGDVLMVNPGEIHDGAPLGDGPRSWRMLFVEPAMVARTAADEIAGTPEIALPAVRDRPLAEAIDELRGYHAGFILLTDGALGARRVSGVYNLNDPVAALSAMAGAQGAVVRRLSPWVLLVSAE